jgi:hypothetical protein
VSKVAQSADLGMFDRKGRKHPTPGLAVYPGSLARQSCLAVLPSSLARQSCPAVLPGNLARQSCPAVLPGSLARQTCPAVLPGSLAQQSCLAVLPSSLAQRTSGNANLPVFYSSRHDYYSIIIMPLGLTYPTAPMQPFPG